MPESKGKTTEKSQYLRSMYLAKVRYLGSYFNVYFKYTEA